MDGKTLRGMYHLPAGEEISPRSFCFTGSGTKLEPHRIFLKLSRRLEAAGSRLAF